jgi:hypothetical protein
MIGGGIYRVYAHLDQLTCQDQIFVCQKLPKKLENDFVP